jgi:DNA modification methylase
MDFKTNQIILGDCLEVMKTFPDESVDCIVTDPPYGYNFMGKDWDKAVPSVAIWKECLRVMKSGAFAFVMSSPRQDVLSQMIVCLGEAGFNTGFTSIYWAYASGFPKAMNVSKMVDKRLGFEREVTGTRVSAFGDTELSETKDGRNLWGKQSTTEIQLKDKPASVEAKLLDGSYGGFQPKPAVEVIIVVMKPLNEKTFVDQALKNGKGVTWLDNARIPFQNDSPKSVIANGFASMEKTNFEQGFRPNDYYKDQDGFEYNPNIKGRFPANLLVSDDCLNDGQEHTSCKSSEVHKEYNPEQFKFGGGISSMDNQYNDSGSFSRYFSLDSWFEEQFKKLPIEVRKTFPFLLEPKASKSERNDGLESLSTVVKPSHMRTCNGTGERSVTQGFPETQVKNFHPTVKPLQIMSYLVTLGSRQQEIILDPFVGSGTACLASKILGRKYIGIELNKEYYNIAIERMKSVGSLFDLQNKDVWK